MEKLFPGFYKIEVPLPDNPLKATNSYIIKGNQRDLIIDTGMDKEECLSSMLKALKELEIDLNRTDFFITHLHIDHLDLVIRLATSTSRVFLNKPDAEVLGNTEMWERLFDLTEKHGFPYEQFKKAMSGRSEERSKIKNTVEIVEVREGDVITVGDYRFYCLETPGHTWGHMCLYEEDWKILVSGDHILTDITPVILSWAHQNNPLKQYISSLDKVYELDIDMVLPGHRSFIYDCPQRIRELKEHHDRRLQEIRDILQHFNEGTAFEIASRMEWDLLQSWEKAPIMQKWFATGEAIAHLNYLEEKGNIKSKEKNGKIFFSLA